ncbi:MAG: riboflavin kinase [Rikenellaceae bacterium]|nr:riboflavin kinase [Rikenellaceae bacterium]
MLGKIEGYVVGGNRLGRNLGFPTANLKLEGDDIIDGVYAVEVLYDGAIYKGVANVGVKPTVEGSGDRLLEVNIFDFDRDIYDQYLIVVLVHYIREERKFDTLDELKDRIEKDRLCAMQFFERN